MQPFLLCNHGVMQQNNGLGSCQPVEEFFCICLGSICFISCLDSCYQTKIISKVEILYKFMFKFMFRIMLAVPQKRKREEMLLILSNTPISKHYSLCLNPRLNIPVKEFSQNFMLRFMQSNTTWILTAI